MRSPASPRALLVFAAAAALASGGLLGGGCLEPPPLNGPFLCDEGHACPSPMVCDDQICCLPGGSPQCPSWLDQNGLCPDGGSPATYYDDLDGDGYGTDGTGREMCREPASAPFALRGGDCNDNPLAAGPAYYPGATEQCDGTDNDCDNVIDDGLATQPYYRDQDGDGFGDPAQRVDACIPLGGYVGNALDCEPAKPDAHPGGTEVCNGVDDDCDTVIDDGVPGQGQACAVPGASGACATGETRCLSGAMRCAQTVQPTPEICDGLDENCNGVPDDIGMACTDPARVGSCRAGVIECNAGQRICRQTVFPTADVCDGADNNCNGTADERPSCGGPVLLEPRPDDAVTTIGVKELFSKYYGSTSGCLKTAAADSPNDDSYDPATLQWRGVTGTSHLFWAEAGAGTWDLSQAGKQLRLRVDYSISSPNCLGCYVWDPHHQPVILVCSPSGHLRLVYSPGYLIGLTDRGPTAINNLVPLRGGNGWVIGSGSGDPNVILRSVNRIEILIQPEVASSPYASYVLTFGQTLFGFP